MEIPYRDGNPTEPGVYVAYVNHEHLVNRAERIMLFWDGKKWYYPMSDAQYRDHVYSHIGPLPVLKLTGGTKSVI